MYTAIPYALITARLTLGPLILFGAARDWDGGTLVTLLTCGVLSDIFDGMIARRLGAATPALRQADSAADVVFWLFVLAAAQLNTSAIYPRHTILLTVLLISELACQALSLARFRRLPATHSYAAKAWGLMLFVGFALLLSDVSAAPYVALMLFTGVGVNLEILAILALAPTRPVDVPSLITLIRANGVRRA